MSVNEVDLREMSRHRDRGRSARLSADDFVGLEMQSMRHSSNPNEGSKNAYNSPFAVLFLSWQVQRDGKNIHIRERSRQSSAEIFNVCPVCR